MEPLETSSSQQVETLPIPPIDPASHHSDFSRDENDEGTDSSHLDDLLVP